MMTLPKINRRTWLALWAQGRRRNRLRFEHTALLPAPVLRAAYPDLLRWDWDLPNPYKWMVWFSLDGGATYQTVDGYWEYGDARQFAPEGEELHFIVGVDETGREITQHSNAVRPSDATAAGALRVGLVGHFGFDELAGDRVDDVAGYVLTETPINDSGVTAVASVAGRVGQAAAFGDGAHLQGQTPVNTFSSSPGGFAVSVWANGAAQLSDYAFIASVWQDVDWPAGSSWMLWVNPESADAQWNVFSGGGPNVQLHAAGDFYAWTHYCLVYDDAAGLWTFYVNGVAAATQAGELDPLPLGRLAVGGNTYTQATTWAQVDELACWHRTLTADEVTQLYNGGAGLPYENF